MIRLYKSWTNLHDRINGHIKSGRKGLPIWLGMDCGFFDWQDFREWALAHGYSKTRCSLDRIKSHVGYHRENLRWVTKLENSTYANLIGARRSAQLRTRASQEHRAAA